jgi:hypothetical protein
MQRELSPSSSSSSSRRIDELEAEVERLTIVNANLRHYLTYMGKRALELAAHSRADELGEGTATGDIRATGTSKAAPSPSKVPWEWE